MTLKRTLFERLTCLPCAVAVLLAALAPAGVARAADTDEPSTEDAPKYLRVVESDDGVVSLEIAATRFESAEEGRPSVSLIGVAHIGNAQYYDQLQALLNEFDVVLYESVTPAGVSGPEGDDDQARVEYTRNAMTFAWSQVLEYKQANNDWPQSIDDVKPIIAQGDSRYVRWFEQALIDGWGNPLIYDCNEARPGDADEDAQPESKPNRQCRLISYGADGQPGGEDLAADIISTEPSIAGQAKLYASADEDNLQSQLADALGLEFQIEAIDYDQPGWVCSDMTIDELNAAMQARGIDFAVMGGTLAGSSLPGRVVKGLLRIMSAMDALMGGALADVFKITLIEMLGDERIMEMSMDQFGQGFGDVIIGERNQIVVDDLQPLIEARGAEDTVAVFYGAGHLADFEQRLEEQLGYTPVETRWFPAMSVNMQDSALSESQLRQMRMMIRRAMYQSMAGSRR